MLFRSDCGANQTVNQEDFLSSVCRRVLSTNLNGLHETQENEILDLVRITEKQISTFPGPIHLNIPIDKPLDISFLNKHHIICILVRNDKDAVKAARNRYEYFDDDESVDDI